MYKGLFSQLSHAKIDENLLKDFGKFKVVLRILASYEAKTANISNFWTFWPVIQLITNTHTFLALL